MASAAAIGQRIFAVLFIVALVVVVGYFASKAIPSAQRPTLRRPATAGTSPRH